MNELAATSVQLFSVHPWGQLPACLPALEKKKRGNIWLQWWVATLLTAAPWEIPPLCECVAPLPIPGDFPPEVRGQAELWKQPRDGKVEHQVRGTPPLHSARWAATQKPSIQIDSITNKQIIR